MNVVATLRRAGAPAVLMVPGFTGSSPGHWQSIWESRHPEYVRAAQRDWDAPEPGEWVETLDRAIAAITSPVVMVGHSLGCITIARWAGSRDASRAAGAMLVAPSDVEAASAPAEVRGFAPIPMERLPFASTVVASTDDPLVTIERARQMAQAWGSSLVLIGAAGHIHTAAGYGPWPEGHALLMELVAAVGAA